MRTRSIKTSLAKRASVIVVAAAIALTAFAGTAYAYFTSQTQASGGHSLELGFSTEIDEPIDENGEKTISMTNTGDTDIMVRIQLFYGSGVNNTINVTPGAEGTDSRWTNQDGVWYWDGVLSTKQATGPLKVSVTADEGVDLSGFDVVVIGQTSPVYYDESGHPVAYLWSTADQNGGVTPVEPNGQN